MRARTVVHIACLVDFTHWLGGRTYQAIRVLCYISLILIFHKLTIIQLKNRVKSTDPVYDLISLNSRKIMNQPQQNED